MTLTADQTGLPRLTQILSPNLHNHRHHLRKSLLHHWPRFLPCTPALLLKAELPLDLPATRALPALPGAVWQPTLDAKCGAEHMAVSARPTLTSQTAPVQA